MKLHPQAISEARALVLRLHEAFLFRELVFTPKIAEQWQVSEHEVRQLLRELTIGHPFPADMFNFSLPLWYEFYIKSEALWMDALRNSLTVDLVRQSIEAARITYQAKGNPE